MNLVQAAEPRLRGQIHHILPGKIRERCRPGFLLFFACLGVTLLAPFPVKSEVLTNAEQVMSLTASQARKGLPVRVTGVVTITEPGWAGRFFMQDHSGGIFVELISTNYPEVGDLVTVSGISAMGGYSPMITSPKWKKLGTSPLPTARRVPIEDIMSGVEDGQRVEVSGIVRSAIPAGDTWDVKIAVAGYRIHVFAKPLTNTSPVDLIGAKVQARGTLAAIYNATLRHLITVNLYVPTPADFVVKQTPSVDPFKEPVVPLNSIAQYRRNLMPGKRVHVRGTVTIQRPGQDFFIEDKTGGLQIKSSQTEPLSVGEEVDAVGFPEFNNFLPVLADAVFHKSAKTNASITSKPVTIQEIQEGLHHADLVTLQATVLDRSFQYGKSPGHRAWHQTRLLLQKDQQVFSAVTELPNSDQTLANIPLGSTIEASGVCFTEIGENQQLKSLELLMPDAASVRVLARPSWWTPRRLLIGLGILFAGLVAAVCWTLIVSKRNVVLGQLIREKEQAKLELQQVNEHLEDRVRERTNQLKFQITARKEAEVQFKGIIMERTRLAQELHDTLEQSLTGIALQLDTTAKLFNQKPESANHHLEAARDQVTQSQTEVRRSIWDLRSRALEQFDLPGALAASARQFTEGAPVKINVRTEGSVRPLPEIIEDNLLRIAQEAMTNIVKHSQAAVAEILLDYGPKNIILRISDNGCGFANQQSPGPAEGHFGLQGISERAKRVKAILNVKSEPGKGTLIIVQVALEDAVQPFNADFEL